MGCGGNNVPRTEAVSGSVTLKGKPLKNIEIYFVHEKLVAMGKTDEQGHYQLVQGAVAGENKVYFKEVPVKSASKFAGQEGMDDFQLRMASGSGAAKAVTAKSQIPAEYSNESEPKLNYAVPTGGTTTADFKL